ncbi:MAG: sugar phosphate isomerase/epimerase family protein [Thermodesulfobacteriota bacterium]
MIPRLYVNAPLLQLDQGLLTIFLRDRLQPEIGLQGADPLDFPAAKLHALAKALDDAGLGCTLHAPFLGLDPAAADMAVRQRTASALNWAFSLLPILRPAAIVCHPHLVAAGEAFAERLEMSLRFWRPLLTIAARHGVTVMFENTYETNPAGHRALLSGLDSPRARFCLDSGHVLAFARNHWRDWLPALEPWLGHLHLHDNDGSGDSHLAPGRGCFDFEAFFSYLADRGLRPTVTLEPHSEEDLHQSLRYLANHHAFQRLMSEPNEEPRQP